MGAILTALPGVVSGAANIVGSLQGKKKIDAEMNAATKEFDTARSRLTNFQFSNPWQQAENTMEDLTVSTQAAEFQAMQADQALAASLDTMVQAGGGAGSAQAIANAALASQQGISASIQQQEQRNEVLRAKGAAQVQNLRLQGEEDLQSQKFVQAGELANLASTRRIAARQEQINNRNQLMQGIGGVAKAVAGPLGGLFGEDQG